MVASLSNAAEGIEAARAMAAAIAAAVAGSMPPEVVAVARSQLSPDGWIAANLDRALGMLEDAGSALAAVPLWSDGLVNHSYNFGNVAAETLPIALAIYLSADGHLLDAVPVAAMIAKQADSMPAMVGALCGGTEGEQVIPQTWLDRLVHSRGITLPQTLGLSLFELSERLWQRSPLADSHRG